MINPSSSPAAQPIVPVQHEPTSPEVDGETLIHVICPHIKQWSDGVDAVDNTCKKCPATVQTSQGEGVQMCRLNAQRCAEAVLALTPRSEAPAPDQAWRDSAWLGLSASEKACYHWPDDTDLHRQCRAAYVAGATDYVAPPPALDPATVEACANIADLWVTDWGNVPTKHLNARDYAVDAVKDIAEAIRALAGSAPVAASSVSSTVPAWQPIETAPHEERVLLGWIYQGAWFCETGMASHGWRRGAYSNMSRHGQATHWMPLPAAPVSQTDRVQS